MHSSTIKYNPTCKLHIYATYTNSHTDMLTQTHIYTHKSYRHTHTQPNSPTQWTHAHFYTHTHSYTNRHPYTIPFYSHSWSYTHTKCDHIQTHIWTHTQLYTFTQKYTQIASAVHGVTKSWTRLSDFTFTFHFLLSCIGEGNGNPLQCFLPGESQGWGSLMGCGLWGHTESDTTEAT